MLRALEPADEQAHEFLMKEQVDGRCEHPVLLEQVSVVLLPVSGDRNSSLDMDPYASRYASIS